ncbi:AAA family ATPase [Maridesulfovibrio ferrireducens]|uniref:AAA family ATPase n=1 Tax=Maridesulfovibrio ferrireducens TaxID=246191 RepID=UPI001A266B81|nr:AAA family ATPase [Maridesulfovibrio ferrireducens]MBI9112837.1 AAA family ATPase [Maridesulfovibrio ferrireducens]
MQGVFEKSVERFFRIAERDHGITAPVVDARREEIYSIDSLPSTDNKVYQLDPLFAAGEFVVIHGAQKTGKSFFTFDLLMAIALGKDYDTRFKCSKACGVLLVDAELPGYEIKSRLNNIKALYGNDSDAKNIRIIPMREIGKVLDISQSADQNWIQKQIEDSRSKVVFFDNLGKLISPGAETSPELWRKLEIWIRSLNAKGVSVILVHHTNKDGKIRGTGKISDDADLVVRLSRPEDCDRSQGTAIDVEIVDSRFLHGDQLSPFRVVYSNNNGIFSRKVIHEDSSYKADLDLKEYGLSSLQEEMMELAHTRKTIKAGDFKSDKKGHSDSSVSAALKGLVQEELLDKEGDRSGTRYVLASKMGGVNSRFT